MNTKKAPTEKQLKEWIQEAHKIARSNTIYTTSMPLNIQRAIARIAYRAGTMESKQNG